ncbi:hypothetical protein [Aliivibrio fischeri]|uniref:hypothetical protein n=1 Tax=Aliivibrio fischeri TaxID=668 RepID=UPI0012DA96A8|nr:hypothetical protein [Aliivibrio fischeri]MUJ39568.1 hypothetical protein [Aliivibrio fischeri]
MAKIKLVCSTVLIVLLFPWYLSLGSAFSGYVKFNNEAHEIIIDAKSGFYRTTHSFEGIVYRTHNGIYTKISDTLIFLPLYGTYVDSFTPELSRKILDTELSRYFRGFSYFKIKNDTETKAIVTMMLKNKKLYPFEEFYLTGRLSLF